MYEDYLRGSDGQLCVVRYASGVPQVRTDAQGVPYVSVDSFGRPLVELPERRIDPVPGRPLHVTLDMALQAEAERTLEGQVGSIVVLNAETGEVLALASVPGYDPGVFVTSGLSHQRAALLNDRTLKPMRNRSFQEVYPPGSTFKVMLACAALEEGVITRNTSFFCPGQFRLSGVSRPWRCWRKGGHGTISVVGALAYSCDVFFYNVGLKLGPEKISEWAARMGLGVRTGLDLPDEATGLIDSPQHKEARFKKLYPDDPSEWKWYPGNTVNLAIGQGAAAITPLQNAVMMAAVLNGGRRAEPYLNLERGPVLSEPFLSPQTLAIVQEGMRDCVEDVTPPSGTGKEARIEGMVVIGKTGTAQAVGAHQYAKYKNELDIPYELRDHALFVAGVMDRSPRIAVSVLIEHGLHGSSAAAPVARHMIEFFYNRNTPTGESAGPIAIAELPGDNNE